MCLFPVKLRPRTTSWVIWADARTGIPTLSRMLTAAIPTQLILRAIDHMFQISFIDGVTPTPSTPRRSPMPRIAALLPIILFAACGGGSGPGLTYYWNSEPRSLDPALSTDVPSGEAADLIFDNLTQFDPDGRLVPGLATSWSVEPDGR